MLKSFKKTIDDGFFPFIIVDAVFDRVKHFEEFWSYAKSKGFQVPDFLQSRMICRCENHVHVKTSESKKMSKKKMTMYM